MSDNVSANQLKLFIERMELNEELFTEYMAKPDLQELVAKWLGTQVYGRLAGRVEGSGASGVG